MTHPAPEPSPKLAAWLAGLAAVALAAGVATHARAAEAPAPVAKPYHAPRTAYGAPDLQGIWTNTALTFLARPIGGFLADRGPGVFATTFRVRDVSAARAALAAAGVRFTQWGRRSLLIRIETGQATADRIELTDED